MESSALKGSYVLADLTGKTLIRTSTRKVVGDVVRFDTIKEAEDYATELAGQKVDRPVAKATAATLRAQPMKSSGVPSAAALFRQLIKDGQLTDQQIIEKVRTECNKPKYGLSLVEWYRKDMKAKGQL